jgi:hypothetical protein
MTLRKIWIMYGVSRFGSSKIRMAACAATSAPALGGYAAHRNGALAERMAAAIAGRALFDITAAAP